MQIHRDLLQAFKANEDHFRKMMSDLKLQQLQKIGALSTEELTKVQMSVNIYTEIETLVLTQISNNTK